MAVKFKSGENAGGFIVESLIVPGSYTIAYLARDAKGTSVFLKQYKKPSSTSGWLKGFIAYQKELHQRIDKDPVLSAFCVRMLDIFTTHRGLCQVFQFIEGGFDLKSCIERKDEFDWNTRVIFAKVMLAALDKLHRAGIVHTDLKPENLMILPDASIKMGYKLRLIDMDFSVLADHDAPWIGFMGFVSSPGYGSPEHARGLVPVTASDVFTCGLMLGELLGDGHPLRKIDAEDIDQATARCEGILPVTLEREIPGGVPKKELEHLIQRCFASDSGDRPTCAELLRAFNGAPGSSKSESDMSKPDKSKSGVVVKASSPPRSAVSSASLALHDDAGHELSLRITTEVGRRNFTTWHEDSKFLSTPQFRLIVGKPGHWRIAHCPDATNATLLDGKPLTSSIQLFDGMVISVGNPEKGIEKFPIHVRIS